jgi:hypothetical protein
MIGCAVDAAAAMRPSPTERTHDDPGATPPRRRTAPVKRAAAACAQ